MTPQQPIETLVTTILRDLVTEFCFHPEALEIRATSLRRIVNIEWRAHRADTSRIIGEKGANFRPLVDLVHHIGLLRDCEVRLKRLGEPVVGSIERYQGFKANPKWPHKRIVELMQRTAEAATASGMAEIETVDIGGDDTACNISIARSESAHTAAVLGETMKHIFGIIGNRHGRVLLIQVTPELDAETQPETAAGRFAK